MSPELRGAHIYTTEGSTRIENIRSDMGGSNTLTLFIRSDKDAFLSMNPNTDSEISIGFASETGGAYISPVISQKFGEIARLMATNDGNSLPLSFLTDTTPEYGKGFKRVRGMRIIVDGDGISIRHIRGDQGHNSEMDLVISSSGDAILVLRDLETKRELEMQFNPKVGGSNFPCISVALQQLAKELASLEPDR